MLAGEGPRWRLAGEGLPEKAGGRRSPREGPQMKAPTRKRGE